MGDNFKAFSEHWVHPVLSNPKVSTVLLLGVLSLGGWKISDYMGTGSKPVEVNVETGEAFDPSPLVSRITALEGRDKEFNSRIKTLENIHN